MLPINRHNVFEIEMNDGALALLTLFFLVTSPKRTCVLVGAGRLGFFWV